MEILGLRSVIHPAPDLDATKAWFAEALGVEPYFDEPFYVGFALAGYELGLLPDGDPARGAVTYWGVARLDDAWAELLAAGATELQGPRDVGEGILIAEAGTPHGQTLGLIENPHFALPDPPPGGAAGPGR